MQRYATRIRQISVLMCLTVLIGCTSTNNTLNNESNKTELASSNSVESALPEVQQETEQLEINNQKSTLKYYIDPRIPEHIQSVILNNRASIFKSFNEDDTERLFELYFNNDLLPDEDSRISAALSNCLEKGKTPTVISLSEAEEDAALLFDYLKYYYSAYSYFGGDKKFHSVRNDILLELAGMGTQITHDDLRGLLVKHLLPVLKDCHFSIDYVSFYNAHANMYFFINEEFLFTLKDKSYCTEIGGASYRLISIEGIESNENNILPYLNAEGEVCWALGRTGNKPERISIEIQLENMSTGETRNQNVFLAKTDKGYQETLGSSPYQLDYKDDIPIVISRRLWAEGDDVARFEAFLEDASQLKDEPIVIIDLRGNTGGDSGYAAEWVRHYAELDEPPFENNIYVIRHNKTIYTVAPWLADMMGITTNELETMEPGEEINLPIASEPFNNRNMVIVLTDQNVMSAAESFVEYLCRMENTVVVGTNTTGANSYTPIHSIYLPNSRIEIRCGHRLSIRPDFSEFECIGHQPDLWAPPDESLERIIKFIEKYNLKNKNRR